MSRRPWRVLSMAVVALLGLGIGVSAPPAVAGVAGPTAAAAAPGATGVDGMIPVNPLRIFETRAGLAGYSGRGAVAPGETVVLPVASALGVAAASVAAVSLNVTVTEPRASGFLTVWPQGTRPTSSSVNFVAAQTVPNGVVVGVGNDGAVRIFNSDTGSAHVIVDLMGWIPAGSGFTAITPVRALETRPGEPGGGARGVLAAGEARTIAVTSLLAGVPAGHRVSAVTVNLTSAGSSLPGFLTLYPSGQPLPPTSTLNFRTGQVAANSAVVGVGPDGALTLFAQVGGTHAIVDITGYFIDDLTFRPVAPRRLADTRTVGSESMVRVDCTTGTSSVVKGVGPLPARGCYRYDVSQAAGLQPGMVGTVAINVTVAVARRDGFLTIWPSSASQPNTSSSNFVAGDVVANTVLVGADDAIVIFNGSSGATDVVIDITGWFPQDSLGLVADGRFARQSSRGTDAIGVIICQPATGTPFNANAIMSRLATEVTGFYARLSENRYQPSFQLIAEVRQGVGGALGDCSGAADAVARPPGLNAVVQVRPPVPGTRAYGQAGPGVGCLDIACSPQDVRSTFRGGLFTYNTIGTPAPFFSYVLHEFGHTLNWPHSYSGVARSCAGVDTPSPYDNPLDIMSGTATGCEQAPLDKGQATIAFNRYSAGWMPIDRVVKHSATKPYVIGPNGSGETEMIVVPSADPLAFTTIEARPKIGDDAILVQGGVAFHRIDQRADVGCSSTTRCTGLERRQQQFPPSPDRGVATHPAYFDGILDTPGMSLDLGGVTVHLVSISGNNYTINVTGTSAPFAPQPRIRNPGARTGLDGIGAASTPTNAFYCGVA